MILVNRTEESGIILQNVAVRYGATTVRQLLEHGYSLAPGNTDRREMEYHSRSQTAMCGFFWGAAYVGELVFYNLPVKPDFSDLPDLTIDLVLLWDDAPRAKTDKRVNPRPGRGGKKSFFQKLMLTLLVHALTAALFLAAYNIPELLSILRHTSRGSYGRSNIPLGVMFIFLPAALMVPVWGFRPPGADDRYGALPGVLRKIIYALWLTLNLALTIAYLSAIDCFF
jgi:hypothetical protein